MAFTAASQAAANRERHLYGGLGATLAPTRVGRPNNPAPRREIGLVEIMRNYKSRFRPIGLPYFANYFTKLASCAVSSENNFPKPAADSRAVFPVRPDYLHYAR